jgi:uncharacterized protein YceH (UPF0502 family)
MYVFQDLIEVEDTLRSLESHDDGPFTVELPRLPGHKEGRFGHLLCGEPEMETIQAKLPAEKAVIQVRAENDRIAVLEEIVQTLQDQVSELKTRFEDFKNQFD